MLIALEEAGEVVAGIAYLPAMDEMFTAARNLGSYCNDEPIHASAIADPSQAVLCMNGFNALGRYGFSAGLIPWMEQFWSVNCPRLAMPPPRPSPPEAEKSVFFPPSPPCT